MPLFKSHIIRGTHKFVTFFVQELVNKELFQNICATSKIIMSIQRWQENCSYFLNDREKTRCQLKRIIFVHLPLLFESNLTFKYCCLCIDITEYSFLPWVNWKKSTNTLEKTLAPLRHFLLRKVFDFIGRNTVVKFALVFVDL